MGLVERVKEGYIGFSDFYELVSRGIDSGISPSELFRSSYSNRLVEIRSRLSSTSDIFYFNLGALIATGGFSIEHPITFARMTGDFFKDLYRMP